MYDFELKIPGGRLIPFFAKFLSTNFKESNKFLLLQMIKLMKLDMLTQISKKRQNNIPINMTTPINLNLITN